MHKNCQSIHGIKAFVDFQPASDSHVGISWLLQVYTHRYTVRGGLWITAVVEFFSINEFQGIKAASWQSYQANISSYLDVHSFLRLRQDCHYLMPTRHRRGHGPMLVIMCRRHDILTCNYGSADRHWAAELLFCIPCSTNYKHWDSTEPENNKGMAKHNLITITSVYFDDCQFLPRPGWEHQSIFMIDFGVLFRLWSLECGLGPVWSVFISTLSATEAQAGGEATDQQENRCLHPDSWALKYNGAAKST